MNENNDNGARGVKVAEALLDASEEEVYCCCMQISMKLFCLLRSFCLTARWHLGVSLVRGIMELYVECASQEGTKNPKIKGIQGTGNEVTGVLTLEAGKLQKFGN